jgi:hypothetical protein
VICPDDDGKATCRNFPQDRVSDEHITMSIASPLWSP